MMWSDKPSLTLFPLFLDDLGGTELDGRMTTDEYLGIINKKVVNYHMASILLSDIL